MIEKVSLSEMIKEKLKKSLKWYLYPLIYFVVSGLVCLYAWYGSSPKGAVKIIFKNITLLPALLVMGIITLWIVSIILLSLISFYIKKKAPNAFIWKVLHKLPVLKQDKIEQPSHKPPYSLKRKVIDFILYFSGTVLIVSGILFLVQITQPYFSLLVSSSKIQELKIKVLFGQVQGNRIIIPSLLIDAHIIEGISKEKLGQGVCHITDSPFPGEGGNCIIEGHNLGEFGLRRSQRFFSLLELVEEGTPVYIFYNGRKYTYKVKEKNCKDVGDPKLYDFSPGERLTLITCVSTWSPSIYTNKRTVVIAYPEF